MIKRNTLVRLADVLEDAMGETGRGSTAEDRALWWACKPLWALVQKMLRRTTNDRNHQDQG